MVFSQIVQNVDGVLTRPKLRELKANAIYLFFLNRNFMKSRFLKFFTASVFSLAVFSFLICPSSPVANASEYQWQTGVEDYTTGTVHGQDGWTVTSGSVTAVNDYAYEDVKSIRSYRSGIGGDSDVWPLAIHLLPDLTTDDDTLSFWFSPTEITTGTNVCNMNISFGDYIGVRPTSSTAGDLVIDHASNCSGGEIIGSVVEDGWYFIEIEFNYTTQKFKGRMDGGTWSGDKTWNLGANPPASFSTYSSSRTQTWYIDNIRMSEDSNFDEFSFIGWSSDLWQDEYLYPVSPKDYWQYYANPDDPLRSFVFDVQTGTTWQAVWGFHHDGGEDASYYDDRITAERLVSMGGAVDTEFTGADIAFADMSDTLVYVYLEMPSFTDAQNRHYRIRFHNLADDEDYNIINFTYIGDTGFFEVQTLNTYDTCEQFDSTWAKAICHMIVPAPSFFSSEFTGLKNDFEDAFPFIFQIKSIINSTASEIRQASTATPTFAASSEWKGMSIQLWDMSIVAPYMETFRGYISIVLWGMFIYYLLHQLLLILKPNE